jgi:membrane protease YdiL (CAAX protease family)
VCLVPPLAALPAPGPAAGLHPLAPLAGALAFGLAAGVARERSESILVPIAFHWLGVGASCLALAA